MKKLEHRHRITVPSFYGTCPQPPKREHFIAVPKLSFRNSVIFLAQSNSFVPRFYVIKYDVERSVSSKETPQFGLFNILILFCVVTTFVLCLQTQDIVV
jgi:hypothetical protein